MNHNINNETLEISFPCASPAPFPRMTPDGVPYLERLQITPEAVDLSRLNGGASILKNHDPDKILGTCVSAWIENTQLWVRAKFRANDPESVSAFKDIAAGTLRNVSVGYDQTDVKFVRESDTNTLCGDVVRWLPLEVSVEVGIPADPTVGFFRKYEIKGANPMAEEEKKNLPEIGDPEQEETKNDQEQALEPKPSDQSNPLALHSPSGDGGSEKSDPEKDPEKDPEEDPEDTPADETAIRSIAAAYGAAEAFITRALAQKMTPAAFAEKCRNADQKIFKKGANMPIQTRETAKFNVGAALRAATLGNFRNAEHELNISNELLRSFGHEAQSEHSFMMPLSRDFTGTGSAAMIGTELRGDLFSEYIGTKLGVKGYQTITGLKQNITIPVQTVSATVKGKKFNVESNSTTPAVTGKTLSPKRLTAFVDVGKDLLLQGVPDAENLVINDLTKALARTTDIALLKGYTIDDNGGSITGVLGAAGVQTVTIKDMSAATWEDITKFAAAVEGKDYSGTAPMWVGSAADKGNFKHISKDAGSGRFILEDNQIDGYDFNVDGNAAAGDLVFGYWDALTLAQWAGLEIIIDPYTLSTKGMVRVIGNIYIDACVRYPELFVKRVA